jgi:hypothetical protein
VKDFREVVSSRNYNNSQSGVAILFFDTLWKKRAQTAIQNTTRAVPQEPSAHDSGEVARNENAGDAFGLCVCTTEH